jgi:hypothetical protein
LFLDLFSQFKCSDTRPCVRVLAYWTEILPIPCEEKVILLAHNSFMSLRRNGWLFVTAVSMKAHYCAPYFILPQ